MDWLLSAMSALMLWLMGNHSRWGPALGLCNQVLWMFYAVSRRQWGLLPGIALYTLIHLRNLKRWWQGGKRVNEVNGERVPIAQSGQKAHASKKSFSQCAAFS